jgi:hypothetical protein
LGRLGRRGDEPPWPAVVALPMFSEIRSDVDGAEQKLTRSIVARCSVRKQIARPSFATRGRQIAASMRAA